MNRRKVLLASAAFTMIFAVVQPSQGLPMIIMDRYKPAIPAGTKLPFTLTGIPGVVPAGMQAAAGEQCWHASFRWRVESGSGTHLYDFEFYAAWCTDSGGKKVTKILTVTCKDHPDEADLEWGCTKGNAYPGASEVNVWANYGYKSPTTGVSPSYRYRDEIDAFVTAKHTIHGTLTSNWYASYP